MTYLMNLFLTVSLILVPSCNGGQSRIRLKVVDIFPDFDFVGSGPAAFEEDGKLDPTQIVAHDDTEKSVPLDLQIRTQYVFHHRGSRGEPERLGREVLPTRLRALGLKVIEAPDVNGGQFLLSIYRRTILFHHF